MNRVRRSADARTFDLACEAARRFGARRLRSIAYERAVEGMVKRHYFHGELKSEEVVHDNRLLIYLLGKAEKWLEPPAGASKVADNWQAWAEAIEEGFDGPAPPPSAAKTEEYDGDEVWEEDDGSWWTEFPPPEGFDGEEAGTPGEDYRRTLSAAEQAVIDADLETDRARELARQAARRDRYFEFDGGSAGEPVFSPREAETYETSAPAGTGEWRGDGG